MIGGLSFEDFSGRVDEDRVVSRQPAEQWANLSYGSIYHALYSLTRDNGLIEAGSGEAERRRQVDAERAAAYSDDRLLDEWPWAYEQDDGDESGLVDE